MYCINCGVKLADTEKVCPLCNTTVYHPDLVRENVRPLYPENRRPRLKAGSGALCGAILILLCIPLLVTFLADYHFDKSLGWFGFVAGALLVAYVTFALPLWFRRPNPVIFVPCSFAAAIVYLLYVDLATGGRWFMSFAFPVAGGLCLITSAVVTLCRYLRRGRLYIVGGAVVALGAFMLLIEFLMTLTFSLPFIGWSIYPLAGLVLIGGVLLYLGINSSARAVMERKLFF